MNTKSLRNWYTTILGVVVAIAQYLTVVGANFPTDAQGWGSFGIGILMAAWGAVMKDGTTGSNPGA